MTVLTQTTKETLQKLSLPPFFRGGIRPASAAISAGVRSARPGPADDAWSLPAENGGGVAGCAVRRRWSASIADSRTSGLTGLTGLTR